MKTLAKVMIVTSIVAIMLIVVFSLSGCGTQERDVIGDFDHTTPLERAVDVCVGDDQADGLVVHGNGTVMDARNTQAEDPAESDVVTQSQVYCVLRELEAPNATELISGTPEGESSELEWSAGGENFTLNWTQGVDGLSVVISQR